ncbi:hypothetical protein [Synechococcus phage S-N03]|uniref:Uncharacterized protein n=1 Tax=Synechococcus phage S-N03 TaxID=2718943 RepID=A0A6G8R5T4_9CAUD|nr:hypothetical protein PQC09_gp098 [Synechococcus phage S-N03]QIN96733.1 hypothetical protein [Synechococcus phage S-N03]
MNAATRTFLAVASLLMMAMAPDPDGGVYMRLGTNMVARSIARNRKSDLVSDNFLQISVLEP